MKYLVCLQTKVGRVPKQLFSRFSISLPSWSHWERTWKPSMPWCSWDRFRPPPQRKIFPALSGSSLQQQPCEWLTVGGLMLPMSMRKEELVLFPKSITKFSVLVSTLCLPSNQTSPLCYCYLLPSEALLQQCGFSYSLSSYSKLFSLEPKPLKYFTLNLQSDFHRCGGMTLFPTARDPTVLFPLPLLRAGDCWLRLRPAPQS